jgi:sarcosine oxidase, subunit alpha
MTHTFSFDGKTITAEPGDTIGSALARNGVKVISRSFKYHRPRGLLCCAGHCPNCLVQVGDEPNVRACTRPSEPNVEVRSQNAWPSLRFDVMSLTRFVDRFLPVGFYYKAFIRPQLLWPLYEWVLRRAAGLGRTEVGGQRSEVGAAVKTYLHADVVVVGGGRSGLEAAIAAAGQGARVLLFDDNPALGGRMRFAGVQRSQVGGGVEGQDLVEQAAGLANLAVYTDTTVLGWWEDNWLAAMQGDRLYKVRARAVVVATGAHEQPLVFANNDLPGVMLGSGVQRLLHLHGVRPGRRAVVVTASDEGWQVAADLQRHGIQVAAVVDQRPPHQNDLIARLGRAGLRGLPGQTVLAAQGPGELRRAVVAPLDADGNPDANGRQSLDCDLIVMCTGWAPANGLLYQAGARVSYDEGLGQFVVDSLPPGMFAAGGVAGWRADGAAAGRAAAQYAGFGEAGERRSEVRGRRSEALTGVAAAPLAGQGKRFVCLCEDVTTSDVKTAIAEGYDSLELLKRYSTISMGPCQGKMCAANSIHLCAQANRSSVAETGVTTARPPMMPAPLETLAGQNMEPVQLSPLDEWHRQHGAQMMVAGLWMRPEHYGDPTAEVLAVRQAVGLIDVSTLGKLRLTGPGVPALLDRLYINQWQNLSVGRVRYGVMCSDEGVVLDDGVTARLAEQEWTMSTTSSGASSMVEWLQWWVQSGWGQGVHVTNVTEDFAAFNLAGPQARQALQGLVNADISNQAFGYMRARRMEVAGVPCTVLRIGFTGELSYEIHCPSGYALYLWQALLDAGQASGIRPFGVEAQRVLRLEKGHIIVGQDTDAMSDPFSAGMAWAVKLDKPDFLGRRSLQRISAEGVRQRLVGFKMARPGVVPEEGLQIVRSNGGERPEIIGWVTSCRHSPTLGETIGLCWLPAELAVQPGAAFTIWRDGRLLPARVHHGAFYDPDGGRLRSEVGGHRSEVGGRRSEVGGRRSEVGDRRSEVGGRGHDPTLRPSDLVTLQSVSVATLDTASMGVALLDDSANGKVMVQGTAAAAALAAAWGTPALGIGEGAAAGPGGVYCLRSDLYLVHMPAGAAQTAAAELLAAVATLDGLVTITDVTHGRVELRLIGPRSADLLSRLCGLDFHPQAFPNRSARYSSVAKTRQLVIRRDVGDLPAYTLVGGRSYAAYLWQTVLQAGVDLGVTPIGPSDAR